MALKETFDDVGVPISATIRGGDPVTDARFVFTVRQGTTSTEQAPVTRPVAANATSTTFGPTAVDDANDFYEVSYKVKVTPTGGSETTLDGEDTLKVWAKHIRVKFTSVNGEDHKNAKFKIFRDTKKLMEGQTNGSGEWDGDLPSHGAWRVEVSGPWEKKGDTKATGRAREFQVGKLPFEARFLKPDPAIPAQKIKQYVNQEVPSGGWARTTPYGNQVAFKIATVSDQGTSGAFVFIKCEFGRESARTTPKPALLASGLNAAPTEESGEGTAKIFKGKIALGSDKTATFTVELGLAGGDTLKVSIGSTDTCDDATLQFENWRRLWYENWMPKVAELTSLTNFGGATSSALSTASTDYLKEVLDQVFIEWLPDGGGFFDKNDATDLEKNAYPASLVVSGGLSTNKSLVLTMEQLEAILGRKAAHGAKKRYVSMVWCDMIANQIKAWNQTIADIDGETTGISPVDRLHYFPNKPEKSNGACGGPFGIERVTWRVTHYKEGSGWLPVAADTDPGGRYRTVAPERTFTARADIEAHVEATRTRIITLKVPAGTSPGNAGYPARCLGLDGSGKLQATGLTLRPTVEFDPNGAGVRSADNNKAEVTVREVHQNKTHTVTFEKTYGIGNVTTDVVQTEVAKLDTWIQSLCGQAELVTSTNKLKFVVSGPADNDRRTARLTNVKASLTARTAVVGLQHPTPAKLVKVEFVIQGSVAKCSINGAALQGNIWMCTHNNNVHGVGLAGVLMHELGHNMGQAYADKTVGLDTSDNYNFGRPTSGQIPGIAFPTGVPGGDIYSGKGHRGTHCAHNVANKGLTDYQSATGQDCLMFGSGDMSSSTKKYFCDNCKKYIRAENLADIRKSWT